MTTIAESLKVSIVQTPLFWEDKTANLRMFEEKLRNTQEKMEVVVLPEMFNTGFSLSPSTLAEKMDGPSVAWMKEIAASLKIILTGSLIIEEEGHFYNRMIWMLPNGSLGYYDKRHLFAHGGEDKQFSSGNKRLIASVKGWKLNLMVCYDLRFPVWARQSSPIDAPSNGHSPETEYDVLIYAANWPVMRNHAWKTLLQARAIENQCYVVGVNRLGEDGKGVYHSGDSMIIDPLGTVLHNAGDREEIYTGILTMESLTKIRNGLPFLRDADPFQIGS